MFASVSVPKTIKEGGGEGRWCTLSFKDRIFGEKNQLIVMNGLCYGCSLRKIVGCPKLIHYNIFSF